MGRSLDLGVPGQRAPTQQASIGIGDAHLIALVLPRYFVGRLGLLAEQYWKGGDEVVDYAHAHRRAGRVKFDPAIASTGRLASRWCVWLNVRLPVADG